ncbi:SDR family NAD(P)-dependent oxidoreductase [Micromonospora haikouensis]|uniref:SDR family NAD(P)-dependent oxidoreductase n=1 Tax=Micromonospora haikouensis TaxID=686309 RepID=UPI003D753B22
MIGEVRKLAIVTGGGRGIGRACALGLADAGYDLVLVDIAADLPGVGYELASPGQLRSTADACRARGAAVEIVVGDVRDAETMDAALTTAQQRFGRVDVLVNGAGLAGPSGRLVHELTAEEWSLVIGVNLTAVWNGIRAVSATMVEQRSGSIINVSSTAGVVGYRYFASYVASKHAVVGLTKAAALDLAPYGVRVNSVCPGSVRDDLRMDGRMLSAIAEYLTVPVAEHEAVFREQQPMNALIEPEDIAEAVVWLAGEKSLRTTGTSIVVDGGFSAR